MDFTLGLLVDRQRCMFFLWLRRHSYEQVRHRIQKREDPMKVTFQREREKKRMSISHLLSKNFKKYVFVKKLQITPPFRGAVL